VREERATKYKWIPKIIHSKTKWQLKKRGWGRSLSEVPSVLNYRFPKPKSHHWPEQPWSLVNSEVNQPTLLMKDEGADYQYNDRPHGCKVSSKCALGSTFASASWETSVFSLCASDPLDVRTSVRPSIWTEHLSRIHPNLLYCICSLFFYCTPSLLTVHHTVCLTSV